MLCIHDLTADFCADCNAPQSAANPAPLALMNSAPARRSAKSPAAYML